MNKSFFENPIPQIFGSKWRGFSPTLGVTVEEWRFGFGSFEFYEGFPEKFPKVSTQQLMRVYGALMWGLGKIVQTPEVAQVYMGSFWDQPLHNDEQRRLFEMEENDLYTAISTLPKNAATRQLNDLIKRARKLRVHAHLIKYLKNQMPTM